MIPKLEWSEKDDADLTTLWTLGVSAEECARHFACSATAINKRKRELGLQRGTRRLPPKAPVVVPKWVPRDLATEFRDCAEAEDEFEAAAWARRELRRMRA